MINTLDSRYDTFISDEVVGKINLFQEKFDKAVPDTRIGHFRIFIPEPPYTFIRFTIDWFIHYGAPDERWLEIPNFGFSEDELKNLTEEAMDDIIKLLKGICDRTNVMLRK